MPYWNDIPVLLKPEKYGFAYQERYDLFYRDYYFLRCKKSKIGNTNVHIWELENRDNNGKIKLIDDQMIKLLDANPNLRNILSRYD